MRKVNVFVSSTCYDLSKVRHELHDSIKSLGHTPILSEFSSFPIDPDKKTIENCHKAVKENADVFVLIIGNRLGYQLSNGRSITNSEYLTARELGTPTYIFIDKKTLSFLPSWQRNKEGNYSDIVDDKGIFEFIEELRSEENWTYEFENPREVKQILEIQLSYLFYEALKMRGRFNSEINDLYKQGLSGQALNILFKEDDLYEVDYFIQVLEDEINKKYQLTKDYEYRIFLDSKHKIDDELELVDWFQHKIGSYILIIESLQTLFNDAMSKYIATSDNPFDGKGLYYCAVTYARIYESLINWTVEVGTLEVSEDTKHLRELLAQIPRKTIKQIREFPFDKRKYLTKIKNLIVAGKEVSEVEIGLTINFDENDLADYQKAFDAWSRMIISRRQ